MTEDNLISIFEELGMQCLIHGLMEQELCSSFVQCVARIWCHVSDDDRIILAGTGGVLLRKGLLHTDADADADADSPPPTSRHAWGRKFELAAPRAKGLEQPCFVGILRMALA
jgi:hypothetical protein